MSTDFLQRGFPSANSILLEGDRPVLVDAGALGGEAALLSWLGARRPVLLVNTHWHSDHTGGNHALAALGVPIAASGTDAVRINAGDPDACRSFWLQQAVPPYHVTRPLDPGDLIDTGTARWRVVALPGHTTAQLGLFDPASQTLVAGDAVHEHDIGWLDLDADAASLDHLEATIEAIAGLAPRLMLSGHGPAITDIPAALARARSRVASWRAEPRRIAWHACKRIFGHQLYTQRGLDRADVAPALLAAPWFRDHARRAFGVSPEGFAPMLLEEMLRSGAATWSSDRLVPGG